MSFLPLFSFTAFLPPKTVTVHSSLPVTPHSLQPHQMHFYGQGFAKLSKVQKMGSFCPGSTPLQAACPHWGAARKGEGFCRADRENEAGKQRKAVNWKVWQRYSRACSGKWCPEGFGMTRFWASGVERVCVKSEWKAVSGTLRKRK